MPIIASPTFYNPQLGQAGANMLTAIFGDPEARMKRDYYDSQVTRNSALTEKAVQEAARLRTGNQNFNLLPDIYRQLARQPGETPDAWTTRTAPLQGQLAQAYPGSNIEQAAKANTARLADIFAQGGVDDMARSLVIQGHTPGKDFAPTMERADAVSARDAAEAKAQAVATANIQAGSAANVARIGLLRPTIVGAGATGYAPQGSPLYTDENGGKLPGLPTKATAQGEAGTRMLGGDTNSILPAIFDPGAVQRAQAAKAKAAAPGKGPLVSQAVLDGIETTALKSVKNATTNNAKTGKSVPVADVFNVVDPDKRRVALAKASEVYVATKNQEKAAAAYLDAMGYGPGSSYDEGGMFSSAKLTPGAVAPQPGFDPSKAVRSGVKDGVRVYAMPDGTVRDATGAVVQ
jgi:hypothetical protein